MLEKWRCLKPVLQPGTPAPLFALYNLHESYLESLELYYTCLPDLCFTLVT